jgi:hypothetical protein
MNKLILAILALTSLSASAASITVSSSILSTDTTNYHYISQGLTGSGSVAFKKGDATIGGGEVVLTTMANGSQFRLGFITDLDATKTTILRDPATSLSTALSMFTPIGEGTANYGDTNTSNYKIGTTGRIQTTTNNTVHVPGTPNAVVSGGITYGSKLFLLLIDSTTSRTGDAADGANEKWALISATDWLIPNDGLTPVTLSIKNVDTAAEVFHGTLGSIGALNSIPEPSISALFLLGAAVGLRRRR